ncbi:galactitol-1-phosphate 5-dehydrogenase [Agathobaculum sp. TL06]
MKALVYYNKEDLRWEEFPTPRIEKTDDVIIKVHYAGVCGSEIARIIGDNPIPLDHPVPHGHEFAGVVSEIGSGVSSVKVGDRVAVAPRTACGTCEDCLHDRVAQCPNSRGFYGVKLAGGWAEYCKVDEMNVVKLPDGITTFEGAFLEPLTVAVHGLRMAEFEPGHKTAIVGCGTIGALTLQAAKTMGAATLTAFDIGKHQLTLARELGAEYTVSTVEDWRGSANKITDGRLFDYVLETGGTPFTEKAAIELTSIHGTLTYIGTPFSDVLFTPQEFEQINRKELWIRGTWQSYSTPFPGMEWKIAAKLLRKIHVACLVDRLIAPEQIFETLEDVRQKKVHGKIMMKWCPEADKMPPLG